MNLLLAVDVPPISNVTIWGSGPLGFNKTAAIYVFAAIATMLVFYFGTRRKDALVPSGILQNTAESGVGFVRNQIIMQTMGTDGLRYLPYLTALFFFIFFSNITEIIPFVQFPANARFGDAAHARPAHVDHLQRGRRREAGTAALPEELARSRRVCRSRSSSSSSRSSSSPRSSCGRSR